MITPDRLEELLQVMARWGLKELRSSDLTLVMADIRPQAPQQKQKVVSEDLPMGADVRLLSPDLGLVRRKH